MDKRRLIAYQFNRMETDHIIFWVKEWTLDCVVICVHIRLCRTCAQWRNRTHQRQSVWIWWRKGGARARTRTNWWRWRLVNGGWWMALHTRVLDNEFDFNVTDCVCSVDPLTHWPTNSTHSIHFHTDQFVRTSFPSAHLCPRARCTIAPCLRAAPCTYTHFPCCKRRAQRIHSQVINT